MPRWLRVLRGAIGTGLMVGLGLGLVAAAIGLVAFLAGELTLREWAGMTGKLAVVASLLGFLFSGALAITARGRSFRTLSLGFAASVGAGAGLLYWLVIGATNAFGVWTLASALMNLSMLTVMGAGVASGALILARRAGREFPQVDELQMLGEGRAETALVERDKGSVRMGIRR